MNLQDAQNKYAQIKAKLDSYSYAMSLASWDMATQAPAKGKAAAAKNYGMLSAEAFSIKTSEQMQNILEVFEENKDKLDAVTNREAELLKEELLRLNKIPKEDYKAYKEQTSIAQVVWEEAKEKSDFNLFAPYLEKNIEFERKFASLTKPEMKTYDAWLDTYEPGITTEDLDVFFKAVREKSVPLIAKIKEQGRAVREDFVSRHYPTNLQYGVSHSLLNLFGYDMEAGVMAASEHPFTTWITKGDVRLTTHFYENNVMPAMLSTIHESGHGIYEQNAQISPIVGGTHLATGVSMGIHESQSRFCENIIGRSEAFWEYFYPVLQEVYKEQLSDVTAEEFYRAINVSKPSLIRIEADELTYNLHIMIRYELEKLLAEGSVSVKELPVLWNEKYTEYLGITPENDKKGILQDVHWGGGMFGYFPSYALGNAYAAQMLNTMEKTMDIDSYLRQGNLKPIIGWLNENVHQYGSLKKPAQLIMDITGEKLNPVYLTDYLEKKFSKIYL